MMAVRPCPFILLAWLILYADAGCQVPWAAVVRPPRRASSPLRSPSLNQSASDYHRRWSGVIWSCWHSLDILWSWWWWSLIIMWMITMIIFSTAGVSRNIPTPPCRRLLAPTCRCCLWRPDRGRYQLVSDFSICIKHQNSKMCKDHPKALGIGREMKAFSHSSVKHIFGLRIDL